MITALPSRVVVPARKCADPSCQTTIRGRQWLGPTSDSPSFLHTRLWWGARRILIGDRWTSVLVRFEIIRSAENPEEILYHLLAVAQARKRALSSGAKRNIRKSPRLIVGTLLKGRSFPQNGIYFPRVVFTISKNRPAFCLTFSRLPEATAALSTSSEPTASAADPAEMKSAAVVKFTPPVGISSI
jgi:hypothetical protein